MNILLVSNFYKPSWETGGVTKVNYELAKNLVRLGHNVTVYTTDGFNSRLNVKKNVPVDVEGVKVYYFYNLSRYFVKKLIFPIPYYAPLIIRKYIRNFDVIHIHEHRSLLAVFVHYYAKKYKVPYILQSHGSIFPHFQKKGLKKFFDQVLGANILKDASKLIALTETEANQYMQMGIDQSKICIIPNGINLEEFENLPEKGEFRKKYSIKESDKMILFLGRIDKIKGIDLLIDAFSQLITEVNNVKLVIVGPKVDNYYLMMIEKVKSLNLTDSVLFTGPLYGRDKATAYVDSDLYILPSRYETFPNTVLESCVCGTPVIITDRCGISDIVVNYKLGSVVKFDKIQLKCAIVQFLNEEVQNDAFCDCVQILKDSFDWSSVLMRIECLYKGITEEIQCSTSSSNDI